MKTPCFVTHLHRLALLGCVGITLSAAAAINDGLVAHYPFNGNAIDTGGKGLNGSLEGNVSPADDPSGNAGQALRFDGDGDYVSIPDSPSWNFASGDFSLGFWVNLAVVKRTMLIGQSDGGGGGQLKWFVEYGGASWSSERIHLHMRNPGGPELYPVFAPFSPQANTWYHVLVTKLGSAYSIYINGSLAASGVDPTPVPNPTHPLTIGQVEFTPGEAPYYLNGLMDDVRIYGRALAADEAQVLYTLGGIELHPTFCPATGNYYQVITTPTTWLSAKEIAEGLTYNGWKGHLATITSASENDFLADLVEPGTAWMGGYQRPGSAEPAGGWEWITGELFAYTAWHSGEPNHTPTAPQDFLQYYGKASMFHGTWNDGGDYPDAFIVEFEPELRMAVQVSQVEICWNSRLNRTYQVEYRSSPATGDWLPLGAAVAGTGQTLCVTDSTRADGQRVYRVRELP